MPVPDTSTVNALNALPGVKTDRGRAAALGLPAAWRGTLGRIRVGASVSVQKENEVRQRLGLAPLSPPMISVPLCPDCGSVHHTRCNGHAGPVVVLGPAQVVRSVGGARRRRKPVWRPCLPVELTAAQRARVLEYAAWLLQQES